MNMIKKMKTPAAGLAASLGLMSAVPAGAQELSAQEAGPTLTTAMLVDSNLSQGDSDIAGDRKVVSAAWRDGHGRVLALETGIVTPQFSSAGRSHDTGYAALSFGLEDSYSEDRPQRGVYASAGVINGSVLRAWQNTIADLHGGTARTSQATSAGRPLVGVAAREDRHFRLAEAGGIGVKAHSVVAGALRTDKAFMMAGGFVSAGDRDHQFRPNISGLPVDTQRGSAVYVGLTAQANIYDVATHRLGTQFGQATVHAGGSAQLGRVTVRAEIQKDLFKEIDNPATARPVSRYMAGVGIRF